MMVHFESHSNTKHWLYNYSSTHLRDLGIKTGGIPHGISDRTVTANFPAAMLFSFFSDLRSSNGSTGWS